jgi:hypothetical protein
VSVRTAAFAALALVALGCSSSQTAPVTADGGGAGPVDDGGIDASTTEPSVDASAESADATADAGSGPTVDGCIIKRASTAKACAENCGARLTLPAGGSFCTIECATDKECDAPGSGLLCPATVGACMPKCSADPECKAAGFARCDLDTKACDTL